MTLALFTSSSWHFKTQILIENILYAQYLYNQCLEFNQTGTDTSLVQRKKVIRFWWPWLYIQGHTCTLKLKFDRKSLCANYILNQWLEFDQTNTNTLLGYGKEWLDFGDFDLIFKVTTL